MESEMDNFMLNETQVIQIVDTTVEKALKGKEAQCQMHSKRLDKFEEGQAQTVEELQGINQKLAVLIDNMADMKKHREELFKKANDNAREIDKLKQTQTVIAWGIGILATLAALLEFKK